MTEKKKFKWPRWIMRGGYGLDTNLVTITILLIVFGLIMVYSASYYKASMSEKFKYDSMYFLKNQAQMSVLGLIAMLTVSHLDFHLLRKKWLVALAILLSLVCIGLLKVPALAVTANGATRWLQIGPISFQVAEPVKIAVIVITAFLATMYSKDEIKNKKHKKGYGFVRFCVMMIPGFALAGILGVISNNMSSALIIAVIGAVMCFAWYPKNWPFAVLFALGVVVIGTVIFVLSGQSVIDAEHTDQAVEQVVEQVAEKEEDEEEGFRLHVSVRG